MPSDAKRPLGTARNATNSQPAYRRLKRANGRHLAFVDLDGRRVYLGEWDSPQSKQAYQRVLVERSRGIVSTHDSDDLFIAELLAAFADHARVYYREPDGAPGREVANFAPLIRLLHDLYGDRPALHCRAPPHHPPPSSGGPAIERAMPKSSASRRSAASAFATVARTNHV